MDNQTNHLSNCIIDTTTGLYDTTTWRQPSISNISFRDTEKEIDDLRKENQLMKLQILKLMKLIEDKQYKSILGMMASSDEKDQEMARLSIRTLYDENL